MKTFVILLVGAFLALLGLKYYASGIKWEEAYSALGVVDPGQHAIALAMAEDEPPEGLEPGKRVHESGMLARIRYEKLDATGAVVARYELRAMVPELPVVTGVQGGPAATLSCPEACRAQLAQANATLVEQGGKAGLADEWLLDMPVGKPFELGQRSLRFQDISTGRTQVLPQARMRVTLLDACQARLHIGTITSIKFTDTPVPLPAGIDTQRWLQLEGCQAQMAQAPESELLVEPQMVAHAEPRTRSSWPDNLPEFEAVKPNPGGPGFALELVANEDWVTRHGKPLAFRLLKACRYASGDSKWLPLPRPEGDLAVEPQPAPARIVRPAYRFPRDAALYFAEWSELWQDGSEHRHSIMLPSSATTCIEHELPASGEGQTVACVPQGLTAETMLVPSPEANCP